MKFFRATACALFVTALFSCAEYIEKIPGVSLGGPCRLLMIYGGGPSTPPEGAPRRGGHAMTVFAEVSDSTYEFGHVNAGEQFERYFVGPKGRFKVSGGEVQEFALRDTIGGAVDYPIYRVRACEFLGPPLRPSRSIVPEVEKPYYSIARLKFEVPRRGPVTVEITASAPDGFDRAD